jgi:hypothetical protein
VKFRVSVPVVVESLDQLVKQEHTRLVLEVEAGSVRDATDRVECALEKLTKKRNKYSVGPQDE